MVPDVVVAAQAIEQGLESRREWLYQCRRYL